MSNRAVLRRPVALAATFALATLAVLQACGGGSSPPQASPPPPTPTLTPTPTPTPTPTATPTPTSTPVDLALADKLYHDGDFEDAIAIYTEVALTGDDDQRRQALWSLAQIRYDRSEWQEAEQALEALLALDPEPEEERRARLLLGLSRLARGENARAQESLSLYIQMDGPAAPYAGLRLAEVASRSGDPDQAIRQVETALAQGVPPEMETDARFDLAGYQDDAGDLPSAAATYRRLTLDAERASERAEALWLLADISRRAGNSQTYQGSLYSLVTRYPWHPRALVALVQPQLAPSPVLTSSDRAVVLFRHRLNGPATDAFRAALVEYEAAKVALQANPTHDLYALASWDKAILLESLGRLEEAAEAYAALVDAAPLAEEAPDALFRAGLVRYRQGRVTDAILYWGRYLDSADGPEAEARARFWLAKAAESIGDSASAARQLETAAAVAPLDYHGLRARSLAADESPSREPQAEVQPPALAWGRIAIWLLSWAGPEDSLARLAFFQGANWQLALELARTGLQSEAESVFADLLDGARGEPWRLYRMARALGQEGQVSLAARAAARLVRVHPDPPRELLTLAYPLEYLDFAGESAGEYGFSPLLLLALVRQESFFDPGAVSSASALGLTQVIPSTAGEIAGRLDEADFQNSDLFRPRVSLRYGAFYLGAQLELFEGFTSAALAAYNAGPGNGLRWWETAADDPDLLLEIIDFSQTHAYVRLVLENYALYRYTYGQAEQPSLPLP